MNITAADISRGARSSSSNVDQLMTPFCLSRACVQSSLQQPGLHPLISAAPRMEQGPVASSRWDVTPNLRWNFSIKLQVLKRELTSCRRILISRVRLSFSHDSLPSSSCSSHRNDSVVLEGRDIAQFDCLIALP
mmetsp:Transcript_44608/g.140785  ORF Transcript_44608/g.140785 Transcript_44608/m.140785 type:complete len:134 (+) Transcript_44608:124-525(+)